MRVSIYAANLHHGGGATGAATFLNDLPTLANEGALTEVSHLSVTLSTTVARDVPRLEELSRMARIEVTVRDDRPHISALWAPRPRPQHDVEFVVRGPHYAPFTAERTVVGFADATMYFPRPEGDSSGLRLRAHHALTNAMKRRLITRYDAYVVQTERLAAKLRAHSGRKPVHIIPNSPSPVFSEPSKWMVVPLPPKAPDTIRLFYPARAYSHKNHASIGTVAEYLATKHSVRLEVVTTLRPEEFSSLPSGVRRSCLNVGEVTLRQCPPLYRDCDGVYFPSLNETSSVTPLEGMAMRRPVIASDRDFNRTTAGDTPFYVDPLDPQDIGETIMRVFRSGLDLSERLDEGHAYVSTLPTPLERSRRYLESALNP